MTFGYACERDAACADATSHSLRASHRAAAEAQSAGTLAAAVLRPDAKSQVTVRYGDGIR